MPAPPGSPDRSRPPGLRAPGPHGDHLGIGAQLPAGGDRPNRRRDAVHPTDLVRAALSDGGHADRVHRVWRSWVSPWRAGVVLAITFIGLALIGVAVRGARGIGGMQRRLAGALLDEVHRRAGAVLAPTGLPGMAAVRPPGPDGLEGHGLPGHQGAPGHAWPSSPPSACGGMHSGASPIPSGASRNRGGPAEWGAVRVFFQPRLSLPRERRRPFVALATVITGAIFFFARPVAGAVLRLSRPPAHADAARPRCHDRQGSQPRTGQSPDRRRLRRHPPEDRAGSP